MSHQLHYLELAAKAAGSYSALAGELRVSLNAPSMWKKRGKVPAEYCPSIERITRDRAAGDPERVIVTCEQLRPDVEWGVVRCHPSQVQRGEAVQSMGAN